MGWYYTMMNDFLRNPYLVEMDDNKKHLEFSKY